MNDITMLSTTNDLAEFCARASKAPYVTVDTEFMREKTYYSKLCLVQLAFPGDGETDAVLVDPLAPGISLDPLLELFRDPDVLKVFHAARQDLEIFCVEFGTIPAPLFDSQVAAMVCGFGEQAGYETLVRKLAGAEVDKSSRFTDWSRRPLNEAQKRYALADVTYLRVIYEALSEKLIESGRARWLSEEMAVLQNADTYHVDPVDAWRRIKIRNNSGRFLSIVQALAQFRETYAQKRDIPRNRVFKDEALVELAAAKPRSVEDLSGLRLLLRDARKGDIAEGILKSIEAGLARPADQLPKSTATNRSKIQVNPALADLLRVLLKACSEQKDVAAKLIASASELDSIAAGERTAKALTGWRHEVFGADALDLCNGKTALGVQGARVVTIPLG